VRNLLKQLVFQLDVVPETLESAYDRFLRDGMEPERAAFVALTRGCFKQFSTVFVFIDAFDECSKQERPILMDSIQQFPKSQLRLFLTVRRINPITRIEYRNDPLLKRWLPQGAKPLEITAKANDIKSYVTLQLDRRAGDSNSELRSKIVTAICSRSAGRYKPRIPCLIFRLLLARFHLNYVPMRSLDLNSLPNNLPDAYRNILLQIEGADKKFALLILSWVFHTSGARALKMDELRDLLATQKSPEGADDRRSEEEIVEVCHRLLVHDKASGVVRFTHITVREFLRKNPELLPISDLAETCLTYLSFTGEQCHDLPSLKKRAEKYKASRYVAQFWGFYVRQAENSPRVQEAAYEFLISDNKRNAMVQMDKYAKSGRFYKSDRGLVHVIAENGLAKVCTRVMSSPYCIQWWS
jgi:hypothetical protein